VGRNRPAEQGAGGPTNAPETGKAASFQFSGREIDVHAGLRGESASVSPPHSVVELSKGGSAQRIMGLGKPRFTSLSPVGG